MKVSLVNPAPVTARAGGSSPGGPADPLDDFVRGGGRLESPTSWFGLRQARELTPAEARRSLRQGDSITARVAAHLASLPVFSEEDLKELCSLAGNRDPDGLEHSQLAADLKTLEAEGATFWATRDGSKMEVGAYGLYNALTDSRHGLSRPEVVSGGVAHPVVDPPDLGALRDFLVSDHPYRALAHCRFKGRAGTPLPAHQAALRVDAWIDGHSLTPREAAEVQAFQDLRGRLGTQAAYRFLKPLAELRLKRGADLEDVEALSRLGTTAEERQGLVELGLSTSGTPSARLVAALAGHLGDRALELAASPPAEVLKALPPLSEEELRRTLDHLEVADWVKDCLDYDLETETSRRSLCEAALRSYPWPEDSVAAAKAIALDAEDPAARLHASRQGLGLLLHKESDGWVELMMEKMEAVDWEVNDLYERLLQAHPWTDQNLEPLVMDTAGALVDAGEAGAAGEVLSLLVDNRQVTLALALAGEHSSLSPEIFGAVVNNRPFETATDLARLAGSAAPHLDDSEVVETARRIARQLLLQPQTQDAALFASSLLGSEYLYEAGPAVARAYLANPTARTPREFAALGMAGRQAEYLEDQGFIATVTLRQVASRLAPGQRALLEKNLDRLASEDPEELEAAVRDAWAALEVVTEYQTSPEGGTIEHHDEWVQVGDQTIPVVVKD